MPHKAMESYDLFGEDGGMLEGLPELGNDNFESAVTGARNANPSFPQQQQPQQQQPTYSQVHARKNVISLFLLFAL